MWCSQQKKICNKFDFNRVKEEKIFERQKRKENSKSSEIKLKFTFCKVNLKVLSAVASNHMPIVCVEVIARWRIMITGILLVLLDTQDSSAGREVLATMQEFSIFPILHCNYRWLYDVCKCMMCRRSYILEQDLLLQSLVLVLRVERT